MEVELLKSKANKKMNFKLMKNVDKDRMLQNQIDQYKLKQFRAKTQMDDEAKGTSKLSLPNIQFSVTTA